VLQARYKTTRKSPKFGKNWAYKRIYTKALSRMRKSGYTDGYGYGYPSARPQPHPDSGGYGYPPDIRISAGIRITGRHLDAGGHPDAHRHPDTGRYPDAHRHPGTGRYRPTRARPSSLKGLVPSDHLGLERKRLQVQPRSPLGVVLPGQSSKQH